MSEAGRSRLASGQRPVVVSPPPGAAPSLDPNADGRPRRVSANSALATERSALLSNGANRPIRVRGYDGISVVSVTGGSPPAAAARASTTQPPVSAAGQEEDDEPTTVEGMARDLLQLLRKRAKVPLVLEATGSDGDTSASASYDAVLYEHASTIDKVFPPEKPAEGDDDADDDSEGAEADDDAPLSASMSDTSLLLSAIFLLVARLCAATEKAPDPEPHSVVVAIKRGPSQRAFARTLLALAVALLDAATTLLGGSTTAGQADTSLLTLFWGQAPLSSSDGSLVSCMDVLFMLASALRSPRVGNARTIQLADLHPALCHPLVPCATELAYSSGLLTESTAKAPTSRPTSVVTTDEEALASPGPSHLTTVLGWTDSFATPALLHAHAILLWIAYFSLTVWLVVHSQAGDLRDWNPLRPRPGSEAGGPVTRMWEDFAWRWWVISTVGYFVVYVQSIRRGSLPQLPFRTRLASSAAFPQFPILLASLAFLFRVIASLASKPSLAAPSYTLLAWSVPFLAASSLVLPSNIPALNPSLLHLGTAKSTLPPAVCDAVAVEKRLAEVIRSLGHFLVFLVLMLFLFLFSLETDLNVLLGPATQPLPPPTTPINVQEYQGRLAFFAGTLAGVVAVLFLGLKGPGDRAGAGAELVDLATLDRIAVVRHFLAVRPFRSARRSAGDAPSLPPPLNVASLVLADIPAACLSLAARRVKERQRQRALRVKAQHWRRTVDVALWRALVAPPLILCFGIPALIVRALRR